MSATDLRSRVVATAIRAHRLIVVLRRVEPRERLLELVAELADDGVRAFEITMDATTAADDIAAVRAGLLARADGPFLVGAGTILRREQLDAARRAEADFGVAPAFDAEVVRAAVASGLPFIPGALTPSEIIAAWNAGATFVKLFPASAVGPALVRELRGPLPDVGLVPTGGIDASNAAAFLKAGAVAVGIGSAITRATPEERRALVHALIGGPAA
jgi:2-dehydro-3-deoxyphosphogluconate aldolase / (4S)-4-hydroxy-2-oxoglutarate aldolase